MGNVTPHATSKVSAGDVEALVEIFDRSDWDELHVEMEGFEIHLSKNPDDRAAMPSTQASATASTLAVPLASKLPSSHAAPAASAPTAVAVPDNLVAVRAPNLGTFYRAPKPGAAPYVELGQEVGADTEVCLIEVMKLFTTVRAGTRGIVRKLCVSDSEMVEYKQPLFLIEPIA